MSGRGKHHEDYKREACKIPPQASQPIEPKGTSALIRKPVSRITHQRIVKLALEGLTTEEIARRVGRGQKAVAVTLAAEIDTGRRFIAWITLFLGPKICRWTNDAAKECQRECFEEREVA